MSNPLTLGLASTAIGAVNGTIGLLKEARDAAKRSDDHDLKEKLSEVHDSVLELKEVIGNLRDENAELRKQLTSRANLEWDEEQKVYFGEEDDGPYCPSCLDLDGKQIRLNVPSKLSMRDLWAFQCRVCQNMYIPAK